MKPSRQPAWFNLSSLTNILGGNCHELYFVCLLFLGSGILNLHAQVFRPPIPQPPAAAPTNPATPSPAKTLRPSAPPPNEIRIGALRTQEVEGPWRRLRGAAVIETSELIFKADEIDYNEDTGDLEARGNIQYQNYVNGETLRADRAIYNLRDETGDFYRVVGTTPAKIDFRPGLLTTTNPFYFEGDWAQRLKDKYILHRGFVTDCTVPNPWWILKAPAYDVIPGDRAIIRNAWFRVKGTPVFYFPYFYKSLKKEPRRSGFLVPNIGNSSRRGSMFGVGYYWAINRSYDLTYRPQFFSQRGFAHNLDFRGIVRPGTDFNFLLYGMNDRGLNGGETASGYLITLNGQSEIGKGWSARGELNHLSSFRFRQEFTESFTEAIFAETHSVGFLTKHWNWFAVNLVAQRLENFQTRAPDDKIVLRKLPELQFITHEKQVRRLPFWFSLDSSFGLVRRNQPLFQTRQFVERLDFAPRISTSARWKDVELVPWFGVRETYYGSTLEEGKVIGNGLTRSAREAGVDIVLPSLSRIFDAPSWMGEKVKHVIEPRATYRYVTGVRDFDKIVRFDETELFSNTNELEFSLTNRLIAKNRNGVTSDLLTWQVWHTRYFDPSFGGAVVAGRRNIVRSSTDLTGFAFLDSPRHYSPIVSSLRVQSKVGIEWRSDFDPLRGQFTNSGVTVDGRQGHAFLSVGHYQVRSHPVLTPSANQFRGQIGWGADNRRGWNASFMAFYDFRAGALQYLQTQVSRNVDCCGLSLQYSRFGVSPFIDNRFRIALAIANIGSFGTLKRQERIF